MPERNFGQVSHAMWLSERVRGLTMPDSIALYVFLLTSHQTNNIGCFPFYREACPPAIDTEKALEELQAANLIQYNAPIIRVTAFLEHAQIFSWQQASSALKALLGMPVTPATLACAREVYQTPGWMQLQNKALTDKPGTARQLLAKMELKYGQIP